jgi:hypothetical protein
MSIPKLAVVVIILGVIVSGCGGPGSGGEIPAAPELRSPVGTWASEVGSLTHFYEDGTGRTENGDIWEFTWEDARFVEIEAAREHFSTVLGGLVEIGALSEDDLDEFESALFEHQQRFMDEEITFDEFREYAFGWFDNFDVRVLFLTFRDIDPPVIRQEFVYVLDEDSLHIFTGPFGRFFSMEPNINLRLSWSTLARAD